MPKPLAPVTFKLVMTVLLGVLGTLWVFYAFYTGPDSSPKRTYSEGRGKAFLSMFLEYQFARALIGSFLAMILAYLAALILGGLANLFVRARNFVFSIAFPIR